MKHINAEFKKHLDAEDEYILVMSFRKNDLGINARTQQTVLMYK